MTANKNLFIIPVILISTMACAFVQNMVFPPLPTPGFSSPQLSTPTAISLTPAEVFVPTSEWISNPEPITCTNDKCLNACLDRLDQVLETRPFAPIGNSIYEEQGASFDLVVYEVKGDEILEPAVLYIPSEYKKYQEDTASHLRIWKFYVAIIPPELRKLVKQFVIFTDGPNGEAGAWVRPSPTDKDY